MTTFPVRVRGSVPAGIAATGCDASATARPALLGDGVEVPLVTGGWTRYVNLDYAASTPPLTEVTDALTEFLPYYSSIHRGTGFKSQLATAAYEGARDAVHEFFDARSDDVVIFTRNTTESVNLLAGSLPAGTSIVTFVSEHHANLLPWRRDTLRTTHLEVPRSAEEAVAALARHLERTRTDLVAITGASNVTGEIWPVRELADVAHAHGARVLLDAAQLAPHFPVSIRDLGVDYMAASGHKMYAPFGVGVLIGRPDWLERSAPFLRGGGAVEFVTGGDVLWTALPDRQEAGSPNVTGAVALGAAVRVLGDYGMNRVAGEELELGAYARGRLAEIPGIELYRSWHDDSARIGVVTFNLGGFQHSQLAVVLSAEFGIGVRNGCFCAHPLMVDLLHVDPAEAELVRCRLIAGDRRSVPGAVRMSMGLGTTRGDVDRLVEALTRIAGEGPRWTYDVSPVTGEYAPRPDPRVWPELAVPLTRPALWGRAAASRSE
ncbi:MAG: aminotransferase class V-fold PLP-dependent enzyme [Candidatus Dormibacteria bacterium]